MRTSHGLKLVLSRGAKLMALLILNLALGSHAALLQIRINPLKPVMLGDHIALVCSSLH